jgi:hypothetical protein
MMIELNCDSSQSFPKGCFIPENEWRVVLREPKNLRRKGGKHFENCLPDKSDLGGFLMDWPPHFFCGSMEGISAEEGGYGN